MVISLTTFASGDGMNDKLESELRRILSGKENPPVDLSDVTLAEMFEFSALSRNAWCEAIGISSSRWGQLRAGLANVTDRIRERAIRVALNGAAVRMNAVDLEDSGKLARIELIIERWKKRTRDGKIFGC